jgi:hypothetical protein
VACGLKGFAQPSNVNINRALLYKDMVPPDLIEKLGPAVDTLCVGHKEVQ